MSELPSFRSWPQTGPFLAQVCDFWSNPTLWHWVHMRILSWHRGSYFKKAKTTFTEFVTCCRLRVSAWARLTRDRMFVTLDIVTVTIVWKTRCSRMLLSYVDAILFLTRLDSNFAPRMPIYRRVIVRVLVFASQADCQRLAEFHERTCIVSSDRFHTFRDSTES